MKFTLVSFSLSFFLLSCTLVLGSDFGAYSRRQETNAERLRRGAGPLPPRKLFTGTSTTPQKRKPSPAPPPPPPSTTKCPNLGTVKSPIRVLDASNLNGDRLGFIGEDTGKDDRYFNYGYSGYYAPGYTDAGGTLFSACNDVNSRGWQSIVISGGRSTTNYIGSFLGITTNQYNHGYSQDIDSYDTKADIVNNYLSPYQCNTEGDLTQEVDWAWDDSGFITADWLQKDGSHVIALPYFNTKTYELRFYGPRTVAGQESRKVDKNFIPAALQWAIIP